MQLVEEGKISLDDPAKTYVPEIAQIQVLDGFDDHGVPKMRAPKSDMTVGQLLLHTAGFGYDFFNNELIKYNEKKHVPSERWEYGSNIDRTGKVVRRRDGQTSGRRDARTHPRTTRHAR